MAKKSAPLSLELDQHTVKVGDSVQGTVSVLESMDPCEGLDVYLEYSGKHVAAVEVDRKRLQYGPLQAGQRHRISLTIPPQMPFSFQSKNINVVWNAVARADVSWAIDPKLKVPLTVVPNSVPADREAMAKATQVEVEPGSTSLLGKIVIWSIAVILAVALSPLLPLVLILIGRQQVLKTRVTDFLIHVPEGHYLLGQWVPVTVTFRLKRAVEVRRVKLTLHGTECWSAGKQSKTHNFYQDERTGLEQTVIALAPGEVLDGPQLGAYRTPGKSSSTEPVFTWKTAVKLPRDGLPAIHNTVYYQLKASAEMPGWPDPSAEIRIKTVGIRVEGDPEAPEHPQAQETSPGLIFAAPGQPLPSGVEAPSSGSGLWGWIGLSLAGVALGCAGVGIWDSTYYPWGWILVPLGIGALVWGVVGFFRKLR